ncbi:hypothetical protein chiPu_0020615, partial [Chiloscyllium punctatum]|nr:hypothetical protein [Chiloscyllium punctatum]
MTIEDDPDFTSRIYLKSGDLKAFMTPTGLHPAIPTEELPNSSGCSLRTPIYRRDIPKRQEIWTKWKERGKTFRFNKLKPLKGIQELHPSEQVEQHLDSVSDTKQNLEPELQPQDKVQEHVEQYTDDKALEDEYDDGALHHILRLRNALGWPTELPSHGPRLKKHADQNIKDATIPANDRGDFLYCLLRAQDDPKARYNPYDLQVVSATRAKSYKQYWTISASYVSK